MQKTVLHAQKRTIEGKKVKNLRRQGILPATLYGKKIKSESIQVNLTDFSKTFKKVGETGLVDLEIEKETAGRPVLIHDTQKHPVSGQILHADFYQVDLKEKVKTMLPVVGIGEAKAVSENKGVLLQVISEIEIEALPTDLPERLEVNLNNLAEVDQAILVKDLTIDKAKVNVLTQPEEIVFKIGPLITKEMEEALKAEEEAKAAAAAATAETAPAEEAKAATEEKKEEPAAEKQEETKDQKTEKT